MQVLLDINRDIVRHSVQVGSQSEHVLIILINTYIISYNILYNPVERITVNLPNLCLDVLLPRGFTTSTSS